jgi:flagellar biosynthesis protein FlhA
MNRVNRFRNLRRKDAEELMTNRVSNIRLLLKQGDIWLILGIFGTVLLLIFPVPPLCLDLLLTVSIALSLLMLLVILYIQEPADFTGFPTLLLCVTLFRLALNVATTRLILLDGYAGHIIQAFGNFVVRGNYIVGLVVFFILVLINFIVITKGAGRIAEVAARFTLDAMPGKQMAIDAELSAGVISETEARTRRKKVEQEADFYGAMDGASKFVRGDAIAAILITLINILGGFGIGVMQRGFSVAESLQRFTLLSIGDGLVSQVPALIISMAAGLLVTRAAAKNNLGTELRNQLFFYPRALAILSGMMLVMSFIPGLPMFPFLVLAVCCGFVARQLKKAKAEASTQTATPREQAEAARKKEPEKLESLLQIDPFQIELGYGLVSLADQAKGGDLLERVTGVRRNFAQEMGVIIPPIRLRDNLQMKPNEYRFLIKGAAVAQGMLMPGYWLAMNASNSKNVLKGVPTTEPVFQLPATWITDAERKNAELSGYTVVDASSVMVTHLSESLKRHCHEVFSRQDVQALLDNLKQTHATVVNELIPALLTVGQVQRVLQNLLSEGISIRNLSSILEKVADHAHVTKNPDELAEYARRALGPQIVRPFQGENGSVRAITLDPRLEQQIAQGLRQSQTELNLVLEPNLARHIMDKLSRLVQQMVAAGQQPLVLCAPQIRLGFKRFFDSAFSELSVLSYAEVPPRVEVQSAGMVELPAAA